MEVDDDSAQKIANFALLKIGLRSCPFEIEDGGLLAEGNKLFAFAVVNGVEHRTEVTTDEIQMAILQKLAVVRAKN